MSKLKKLVGQTFIYGVSSIIAKFLTVFLTPIYTESFSEGVYGQVVELYAYTALLNVVLTFGMETTFFRFLQDGESSEDVYPSAFSWILTLCLGFGFIIVIFHPFLATSIGYADHPEWILILGGVLIIDAISAIPMAKLRQEDKANRFALINIVNILITISLNVVFILGLGLGITYIFIANIIASFIKLILALWRNSPSRIGWNRSLIRPMLQYGGFIMIAGLPGMLNEVLDRTLIPMLWPEGKSLDGRTFTGLEMNGVYGANYRIAMLISLATQAFRYAAEPFFFKEAKDKNSPETFARVFHYFMLASLTACLLISVFAYDIASFDFLGIPEFFGREDWTFVDSRYWIGLPVVPILLMAYVFQGAYLNMSFWFKITKQTQFALLFVGSGAVITVSVNYWGIPIYGYMASAWATFFCYALMCLLVYVIGQRYYPIPYRMLRLFIYVGVYLGAYLFIFRLALHGNTPALWGKIGISFLALSLVGLLEYFFPIFLKSPQQ